jgi:LysM repeat protein
MKSLFGYICLFLFLSSSVLGQEEEIIETLNGKKYLIHIAEKGNTVYGLHKIYDIPIETLVNENPTIENGIQIGQRIKIPYHFIEKKDDSDTANDSNSSIINSEVKVHTVQPRETLFGISRKYNCSIEEIKNANVDTEHGIRIGQKLIIPCSDQDDISQEENELVSDSSSNENNPKQNYVLNLEDSTVLYTVQTGETLYSISRRFMVPLKTISEMNDLDNYAIKPGDVLTLPLKHEVAEKYKVREIKEIDDSLYVDSTFSQIEQKDIYNIAFLLPIKIKENGTILSGIIDKNSRLNFATDVSIDFYMGIEKALDSLKKLGLSANVKIIDTQGDGAAMKAIIENGELQNMDLVFGPFYPKPLEVMAEWAKLNTTPIFVPVGAPREIVRDNPYVNILVPSKLTQVGAMARYIAENHSNHNLKIIKGRNDEEKELINYFMHSYNFYKVENARNIIEIGLGSSSGRDMARMYDIDTHNIFICLSENYQHVMQFINTLNASKNHTTAHGKAKVTAFGMREWMNINSLNSYYKNRFELHTPSPLHIDYSHEAIRKMVNEMHSTKNIDPSRYFFQGFDVTFQTINKLILRNENQKGFVNNFDLEQIGPRHGKENTSVYIIRQQDFSLQLMDIVNHHPIKFKDQSINEGTDQ